MELHTTINPPKLDITKVILFDHFWWCHIGFQAGHLKVLHVHKWIDHTPKHGIRYQDHLSSLNNPLVMLVSNFGYLGAGHIEYGPKSAVCIFSVQGPDWFCKHTPKSKIYEGWFQNDSIFPGPTLFPCPYIKKSSHLSSNCIVSHSAAKFDKRTKLVQRP